MKTPTGYPDYLQKYKLDCFFGEGKEAGTSPGRLDALCSPTLAGTIHTQRAW